jgi:ribonuclease E
MDKNKMLIDATHPEETRVVALRNGRVEEFDFESAARKLLRGNIYLAKVTRVEPSLQAAFIEYGGNRHGFLAFNEIHPDYYQIPVADREMLKQEEAEAEQRAEAEADERARSRGPRRRRRNNRNERNGESSEGQGAHQAARDDQSTEISTFEDGYQTSGADVHDDEPDAPAQAVPLRSEVSSDDVRHAEPDARHYGNDWSTGSSGPPESTPARDHEQDAHLISDSPPVADVIASDWSMPADVPTAPPAAYPIGLRPEPREAPIDLRRPDNDDDDADDDDHVEGNGTGEDDQVEQIATEEDILEEVPERPRRRARQYKIQEVIKRRQIMLVQVVKEERGNKGAALTTYISLAGRYTVLMPNTARGGGISRKITQPQDRKRLKAIADELDVEEGMGLIIRTAGAARTKQEIKRDYDYLIRLWDNVRELTLSSTAPCLVYEEGNIIKRAIRDLYSKEFDQIVVAGDAAHREAQDFMEMLMPGSGSHVASYRAPEPLFARYGIERQLNALFSPYVTLRSGGYIVINQTEALVSVDVNSGKSTREFSIEETALNTNLEAAEEIARQLKLRDLAGLIVVDFIDMEEKRNNRNVERRLKDALRFDRARIQVGRISHFGLLEMSRQRLRAGVLEGSTSQCPHCQGTGIIRSIESVALAVLRGIEDHLLKQPSSLAATTTAEVALYILNHKRAYITEMERRYGVTVRVEASDRMQGANFGVERIAAPVALAKPASRTAVSMEWGFDRDEPAAEALEELPPETAAEDIADVAEHTSGHADASSEDERPGRRRRRRRGRRDREGGAHEDGAGARDIPGHEPDDLRVGVSAALDTSSLHATDVDPAISGEAETADDIESTSPGEARADGEAGEARRRGRRRGRRGGRARRREGGESTDGPTQDNAQGGEDADRHEWGIAEVSRPGADQPFSEPGQEYAPAIGLVASVDEVTGEGQQLPQSPRPAIVESSDAPYAFSSAEAVRLAVTLAGGSSQIPTTATAADQATEPDTEAIQVVAVVQPEQIPVHDMPSPAPEAHVPACEAGSKPAPQSESEPETAPATWSSTNQEPPSFDTPLMQPQSAEPVAAGSVSALTNGSADHDSAPREHTSRDSDDNSAPMHEQRTTDSEPVRPSRRGWWQRRFGSAE